MIVRFTESEITAINALEAEYDAKKAAIEAEIERLAPDNAPDTESFFAGLDPDKDPEAWSEAVQREFDAYEEWEKTGSDEWRAAKAKHTDLITWVNTERGKLINAAADRQFAELNGDVIAIVDDFKKQVTLVLQSIYDSEMEQQQRLTAQGGGYRSSVYCVALGGSEWKLNPDEVRKSIKTALHWHYDALADMQSIIDSFDRFIDETISESDYVAKEGEGEAFGRIEAPPQQPKYRTKAAAQVAGVIVDVPSNLAIPTLQQYQYTTSLYNQGNAYIQPFVSMDGLLFNDGKLYFEGTLKQLTEMEIQDKITKQRIKGIKDMKMSALRTFYSYIYFTFQAGGCKSVQEIISISVTALAMLLGKTYNLSERTVTELRAIIDHYHNMVGVIHEMVNGKMRTSYYQVLTFQYYDAKENSIAFTSPYMNRVIELVHKASIVKDRKGNPVLKKNGEPKLLPAHSFLLKPSLQAQRNDTAADNVQIIVTMIEQAGDSLPRIRASTIIERNPQLQEKLNTSTRKGQLLKRTFTNTWEYLRDHTRLTEVYKDIQLPDPNNPANIPTPKTLNMVFSFPHNGKKEDVK